MKKVHSKSEFITDRESVSQNNHCIQRSAKQTLWRISPRRMGKWLRDRLLVFIGVNEEPRLVKSVEAERQRKILPSRRVWLACLCGLGIGLLQSRAGWASELKKSTKATPKTHYLISAILREGVQNFTFRLVHATESGASLDEAMGIFIRRVLEKFPGYAIAQTVVMEVLLPAGACSRDQRATPHTSVQTIYAVSVAFSLVEDESDTLLVNGWLAGNSADEALNRVLRDVTAKNPLFIPVSTLITELDLTRVGCPAPGPAFSLGEQA